MNAGRELDALVAEKVMGRDMTRPSGFKYPMGLPRYSTDIAAAWQVVEHMRGLFSRWLHFSAALRVEVGKGVLDGKQIAGDQLVAHDFVWRLVKPEHICRAALEVAGKDVPV